MNKKAMLGSLLFAAGLLATSCGGGDSSSMQSLIQSRDHAPITVEQRDIQIDQSYSATIRGQQDIEVLPQVGGTLTQICVTEGQRVSRGQTLFIIDQVPYKAAVSASEASLAQAKAGVENARAALEGSRAQLTSAQAGLEASLAGQATAQATVEQARAALATAQLQYDSKKNLYDQKIVSSFDLQTAQNSLVNAKAGLAQAQAGLASASAQVNQARGSINTAKAGINQCQAQIASGTAAIAQAQANLVNAKNNLSYTVVKAPADGVVGELPYRQGALVSSNMPVPLTTVSDNNSMFVYFSIDENKLLQLSREYGSTEAAINSLPAVTLNLADGTKYGYEGRVESISGVINQSTGTSQLRAVFPNPEHMLHSGNTGNVVMPTIVKNAIVIPQEATVKQQDKYVAYKIYGNIARPQLVDVELQNDGKNYIVKSGLKAGDKIIGTGVGLLHGDSIQIDAATEAKKKMGK